IEGGRRPQRRRRPQPKCVRKQCLVRPTRIAKEAVDRLKKRTKLIGVQARCQITPRKTFAKPIVRVACGKALLTSARAENADVASIHEREDQAPDAASNGKKGRQRRPHEAG